MRIFKTYQIALLLLLCLAANEGIAQVNSSRERVSLFTDRDLYISGEDILFSACLINAEESGQIPLSKVLYLELITPEGFRLAGEKYALESGKCSGCLTIPNEALSGYYYLKAYSKFMRNDGPGGYFYKRILVVNPVKKETLPGNQAAGLPMTPEKSVEDTEKFTISTATHQYSARDEVIVTIAAKDQSAESFRSLCLTVAPEYALDIDSEPINVKFQFDQPLEYLPETRGVSLTGRLVDSASAKLPAGIGINLSIIGQREMIPALTDSSGRFFISLPPLSGEHDLFLSTKNLQGLSPVILIDNDFCPIPVSLPAPEFSLTESQKKGALDLAINLQLLEINRPLGLEPLAEKVEPMVSFYGHPTQVLNLDRYIELPSLEEYFNELPIEVKVRKNQGRKLFRFASTQPEMTIFDPLVMVDWVALDDIEKVLSVSPRSIESIELVNAPYVIGSTIYGGIISIISRKEDFAGIDLPASGTFINYRFFKECPDDEPVIESREHWPMVQNTILWVPELPVGVNGEASCSFRAPDIPGTYTILLRGMDGMSNIIQTSTSIEIH